jgi:DNA replication protein DnaC
MEELTRSRALNNIPPRKLREILAKVEQIEEPAGQLNAKAIKLIAINRYAESNIPIEYWPLKMEKNFIGDPRLLTKFNEYTSNLRESYTSGSSICFAGGHGLGKTMTITCILKKASEMGYNCLYTTLSDIVSVLTTGGGEDKFLARRELALVDFLAIDEFDSRFMPSENAADLYARSLESVFRTRSQNKLPTLMGTNSPNPVESFNGTLKASISSLMKGYVKLFSVAPGIDQRGNK